MAENSNVALYVLSDIEVERHEYGSVTASGGKARILDPWTSQLASSSLSATDTRCLQFEGAVLQGAHPEI